jgi:hypothetical protein
VSDITTTYTAFRCPDTLLAKVKAKAKEERRTLSNFIIKCLEDATEDVALPEETPTPTPRATTLSPASSDSRNPPKSKKKSTKS